MKDLFRRGIEYGKQILSGSESENPTQLSEKLQNLSVKISSEIARNHEVDGIRVSELPGFSSNSGVNFRIGEELNNAIAELYLVLDYKSTTQATRVSEIINPLKIELSNLTIVQLLSKLDEVVIKLNQISK